ncbi:hypothetical protein QTP70_004024 [Hemibagrus guttatus]|uniref:ribonuclease H n=1 Tax=Hemibagrus guttatus TaxID=175788 RepID=A0AAE0PR99_9TELE|nr:hypothetical protein QTP70_004024 [Hemibagrus guttatus]
MRKSGVAEKYVRVVQDMYERSRTVVRCAVGQTEEFNVEVGLHQGSALSPFLFAIVMDQLSEEVRQESPWTMMFADDIVICSESREQVEENLERRRFALERRGMKVSRSKTEYMCVNEREGSGTVRLQGEEVKKVQEFKYLGSTVQSNGECGKEVKKRVQAGWNGWRKVSGVLCDQKISARIKGKVYRTVVRPAMLYGLETVSLRKRQESELEVAELKMLRFSLGVTRLDRIRNEYIRGTAHVGRLGDKVREARLRWFGHVQRREKTPDPQELLATVAQHESTIQRLEAALAQQETLMATHSQVLTDLMTSIRQIFDRLPSTSATASAASVPLPDSPMPSPLAEPRLPPSQRFSGDPSACDGFLTQCSLTFELQPSSFPSDRAKIAYVITLLSGKALSWATAVWKAQAPFCSSYTRFVEEFKRVFDHPLSGRQASKNLLTLRQKNGSATEYAIQFRTIAAGSGWNDESLMVCFLNGLSEAIKDDLAIREPARDLENLIDQAIRLDNRLRERNLNRPCVSALSASPTPAQMLPVPQNSPEPMQLGRTRLSPSEQDRRMRERCCLYCGLYGHFRSTCPELSGNTPSRTGKEGL